MKHYLAKLFLFLVCFAAGGLVATATGGDGRECVHYSAWCSYTVWGCYNVERYCAAGCGDYSCCIYEYGTCNQWPNTNDHTISCGGACT